MKGYGEDIKTLNHKNGTKLMGMQINNFNKDNH